MQDEHDPLLKENPGHLFRFEEKVFGLMTLPQLLCDLVAGLFILAGTASLTFSARVLVSILLALLALLFVHGKVQDDTFLHWLFLSVRWLFLPRVTSWQDQTDTITKRKHPAIQTTWIPFTTLERGIAGYSEDRKGRVGRYWAVLEVEGRTLRYLPHAEQVRLFKRLESTFTGLQFRLQFLSLVEQVHQEDYPPLQAQREALHHLHTTPRLAALQQRSLAFQQRQMPQCTLTRHFVIISVSAQEEALRRAQQESPGMLPSTFRLVRQTAPISREQILEQLRIRCSVVKKALADLDVRSRLLSHREHLQVFTTCLALGAQAPSFQPEPSDQLTLAALAQRANASTCLRGLHGQFSEQQRFEAGVQGIANLVAPSRIEIHPDCIEVEVQGHTRYQRYFTVVGYGHHLLCGWVAELAALGLSMLVSIQFEPFEAQYMVNRLETQQVKLESKRVSDQSSARIIKAAQTIEAKQVHRLASELAAGQLSICAVTMTIGLHASNPAWLEERSRYLLSHLRQRQLQVRRARRQQDRIWQASLPICAPVLLDHAVNLPSDACSTFLHVSSGAIGTPNGVFLGFVGSGMSRKPVFFNPWSAEKHLPNPHIVVVGESGMGKSWLGKTLVTGLMGMGIADVVILDRDDDYLRLHKAMRGESQRYNLARHCPINFFDIPYGPADVEESDEPADLLSEFLDNHLMLALALIVTDTESGNTRLSKIEEAYLMQVARLTYAAKGITSEAIGHDPRTLLLPAPTLTDFIATMKETKASSEEMRLSLLERLEKASYLFAGQTSISISKPLTIFSIHDLDEKWYPLMTFVVQNFLYRHRAQRRDERYLAYVVEEASFMLRHPAGRRYLEIGSRAFRKLGIAQFTFSQHPRDFLEDGAVILSNAGTAFYLSMQRNAAEKLQLTPELERVVTDATPGQAVMRCGNEYAAISIASNPSFRAIFTTDPHERKQIEQRKQPVYLTGRNA